MCSNTAVHHVIAATQEGFDGIEVEYVTMPGWQQATTGVRSFENLPKNAQRFVQKVEELVGVPGELDTSSIVVIMRKLVFLLAVRWIGVGPSRDSVITRF